VLPCYILYTVIPLYLGWFPLPPYLAPHRSPHRAPVIRAPRYPCSHNA